MENVDLIEKLNAEIEVSSQSHDDGAAAFEAGAKLQQESTLLLNELKSQRGAGDEEYEKLVDTCAVQVVQCCLDSYNLFAKEVEKGNVERFKEYLPKIKDLLMSINVKALSPDLKEYVYKQRVGISDVIDHEEDYIRHIQHICYYCGKNKAVESANFKQNVYVELERVDTIIGSAVQYLESPYIEVDRCKKCKAIHERRDKIAAFGSALILCAVTFAVCMLIELSAILLGLFIGGVCALIYYKLFFFFTRNNAVKNKLDTKNYPEIRHRLEKGWSTEEPKP